MVTLTVYILLCYIYKDVLRRLAHMVTVTVYILLLYL